MKLFSRRKPKAPAPVEKPKPKKAGLIEVEGEHKASIFRQHQNRYLKEYCTSLPVRSVLNTGAKPQAMDKEGQTYESYFPDAVFYTLDLEEVPEQPNHFKADLLLLDNINQRFDLILMMSVLEHVTNPFQVGQALKNILTPQGYIYIAAPFFYPVHSGAGFGDYWRFTPESMEHIFDYCKVVQFHHYPSVIRKVDDRPVYWNKPDTTFTGFSMLLQSTV